MYFTYRREGKKEKKKEVGYVLEAAALEFPIQYLVYYTAYVSVSDVLVAVLLRHVEQIRAGI